MKRPFALCLACALIVIPVASAENRGKLSSDLIQQIASGTSELGVIVQFKRTPTQHDHDRIKNRGGRKLMSLAHIGTAAYRLDAKALDSIADDDNVVYITPDRPVQPMLDYTAGTADAQFAWQSSLDGTGIGVAVIDSGIYLHDDLRANWRSGVLGSRIVYSENLSGTETGDDYGHGTHVAGIIGGNGTRSTGSWFTRTFKGIAPNVSLIDLRVLDAEGKSTDSVVIAAIQRAIQLKSRYNIRVINLSLGRPVFESYQHDPLCQAVERDWHAGIVVVVAAGNLGRYGYGTITAPGNDPLVITVGAMKTMGTSERSDDQIASYSSKGPSYFDHVVKPDIVAPGNLVDSLASPDSTLVRQLPGNAIPFSYYTRFSVAVNSPDYFQMSGTSMATPVVSGAAALMIQKDPSLKPDTVKARLMKTAAKTFPIMSTATDPVTGVAYVSQYDVFTVGAGYLDISAALANSEVVAGSAQSPAANHDASSGQVTPVLDASAVWGTSSAWGTSAVWGSSAVWGISAMLETSSVWGGSSAWDTEGLQGFSAVWGTCSPVAMQTSIEGEL